MAVVFQVYTKVGRVPSHHPAYRFASGGVKEATMGKWTNFVSYTECYKLSFKQTAITGYLYWCIYIFSKVRNIPEYSLRYHPQCTVYCTKLSFHYNSISCPCHLTRFYYAFAHQRSRKPRWRHHFLPKQLLAANTYCCDHYMVQTILTFLEITEKHSRHGRGRVLISKAR